MAQKLKFAARSHEIMGPKYCIFGYFWTFGLAMTKHFGPVAPNFAHKLPSIRSVGPSVRRSIRHTLLFLGFSGYWPYCSCLNDLVTLITGPVHLHATGVAV